MNNFSKEEKAMLINGLEALLENVQERKNSISDYVWYGVDFGLIRQNGDDYDRDRHYWKMKDKIKQKFEDHEAEIIKLRNKLFL